VVARAGHTTTISVICDGGKSYILNGRSNVPGMTGKKALLVRMRPDLYDALVSLAAQKDLSLNSLADRMLREAVSCWAAGRSHTTYLGIGNAKARGRKALLLRVDPDLYTALVAIARNERVSLNRLVSGILREAVARAAASYGVVAEPGDGEIPVPRLVEKLTELAEFQMEPGFDGYTRNEMAQALMNALGLTSVRQAVGVMSRLIRAGVLVANIGDGGSERFFINGSKLAHLMGNGPAGQAPAPSPGLSVAREDRVRSGEQIKAHSGVDGR
jgi:predicted HicB family RNase H-like nuclease